MNDPHQVWTVRPHGEVQAVAGGLWTVEGTISMPLGKFERRMTVARKNGGSLVVFSPVSLDEKGMAVIDGAGAVETIVVPSARHRMDVKPWKTRYPNARVVAPSAALSAIVELVPVERIAGADGDGDGGKDADPSVALVEVPGTDAHEAAMIVTSDDGVTVVINELIFNVPDKPGFGGWLMGVLGMTGDEPHMPGVIRMREVKDKAALARQLKEWAALPRLQRVIVSHGKVIASGASEVLEKIGAELAG